MAIRRTNKPVVQKTGGNSIFGSGTDGPVTVASGTTSLVRDMYYTNLTVDSGATLFTNGFRVFVNGTFTNNGTVGMPTATAHSVADGSGTIAGRQTSLNPSKAWGTSTDPISVTDLYDLDDAMSGFFITGAGVVTKIAGGSLGVVGSNGTTTPATGPFAGSAGNFPAALTGQSGGAGNAGTAGNPATAGTGGAGGLGGGLVIIFAKTIAGSGTLVSYGFAGSAGNPATQGTAGPAGNPAPNITGYHTSGTFHHPAGSTGPNPGAGNPHPAGHNPATPHPAGSTPGNPHPASHNAGTHHHPANSITAVAPFSANPHPSGHNPHVAGNPHGASHNAGHGTHHHPSGHNPAGPYNPHNKGPNPGNPHPAGNHTGHHGNGGHRGFTFHSGNPHPAGHNPHVAGNPHPSGHNSGNHHHPAGSHGPHAALTAGNPHPAGHNPATPHPAGSTPGNPHPASHNAGTHPHTVATVNLTTGTVTSNRGAAPSHTATNANYTGGAGGAAGVGGTANPGGTGVTGSTGGIIVVTRNAGNAAGQIGHSNYSKIIDI